MKRIAQAGAVLSLVFTLGAPARAQTAGAPDAIFITVDAVTSEGPRLWIQGIRSGEDTATKVPVMMMGSGDAEAVAAAAACEKKALLVMSRPGQYRLEVKDYSSLWFGYCRLVKVVP